MVELGTWDWPRPIDTAEVEQDDTTGERTVTITREYTLHGQSWWDRFIGRESKPYKARRRWVVPKGVRPPMWDDPGWEAC